MNTKKIVKFGDICQEVKLTTKDPISDGFEYYIGLEHLDSNSLTIKRWGIIRDDNPSFTRVFKKGHILFGKRRSYLKKAAIAKFDGICSSDIIVMEPIGDIVLHELVPYIVQSEKFWQWAIKTSSGSLSPRTKWKELAIQSFAIPEHAIQCQILELFRKSKEVSGLVSNLKYSSQQLYKSFREKKISALDNLKQIRLGDIGYTYNGLQGKVAKDFDGGNASFIPYMNIFSSRKVKLDELGQVSVLENETQHLVQTGDIFFTVSSETPDEVGMSAVLIDDYEKKPLYLNSFCVGYRPNLEIVSPRFLSHYLRSDFFRKELRKLAQGITRYNISRVELMKCPIYLPKLSKQIEIANILDELDDLSNLIEINYEMNKQLNRILLSSKIGD